MKREGHGLTTRLNLWVDTATSEKFRDVAQKTGLKFNKLLEAYVELTTPYLLQKLATNLNLLSKKE